MRFAFVLLLFCLVAALIAPVTASFSESTFYAPNCFLPSFQIHGAAAGTLTVYLPTGQIKDVPFDVKAGCIVIELPIEYQKLTLKTPQGKKELERTKYGYALVDGQTREITHPKAVFARWSVAACGRVAIIYDAYSSIERRYESYLINYDDFGGAHAARHYFDAFLPPSARNIRVVYDCALGKKEQILLPNDRGTYLLKASGATQTYDIKHVEGDAWGGRTDAPFRVRTPDGWIPQPAHYADEGFDCWDDGY